jgi:predicted nucleotidyltransferase
MKKQVLVFLLFLITINLWSQTFTDSGISLPDVSNGRIAWGDYDNDGDLDILLTGDSSGVAISHIFRNGGGTVFTPQYQIKLTGVSYYNSVAWGDYDNDGDLDILITGNSSSGRISKIYRNNSNNTFTEQNTIALRGVAASSVVWGDYDNDGDLDILLSGSDGNYDETTLIYKNNGDNSFTEQASIELAQVAYGRLSLGDYDNDGDLDILLTGMDINNLRVTKIYRNNGNDNFTEQADIILTGVNYSSIDWGDYDIDGDMDILLTGSTQTTRISKIYNNNGNGNFPSSADLTGVSSGSTVWGDYDNDGDLDILLTGSTNGSYSGAVSKIYRNDSGIFTDINAGLAGAVSGSSAWGDYDNDGDLDILITGTTTTAYNAYINKIYKNNGTVINTVPTKPTGLISASNDSSVTLKWKRSTDTKTPSIGLTYNLRRGSAPNMIDYQSPMASLTSGLRLIPSLGNILLECTSHR